MSRLSSSFFPAWIADLIDKLLGRPVPAYAPVTVRQPRPVRFPVDRR
jgi:hypothetical protein